MSKYHIYPEEVKEREIRRLVEKLVKPVKPRIILVKGKQRIHFFNVEV